MELTDENSKRFIAVLNKKIESGRLMNALGHMTAGLADCLPDGPEKMCFLQYVDGSGGVHPHISHFPFIILAADNSNQIRSVRVAAQERGIAFTDFTSTMTVGTSEEQLVTTRATAEPDLEYFGICLFGETETLREFTKKFSLFK